MTDPLVIAKDVVMDFYTDGVKSTVLHGVSLGLEPNKVTMLVGPSGSGKTTFISILTGMLTPTSGQVIFDGIDIFALSNYEKCLFRRKEVGFVFQQHNLLHTLSAAENAAVPLLAAGVPMKIAKEKAVKALESLGMGRHVDKLPTQLSGGEQQRVAIARALVHEPRFIVCDEPTASLDEQNGKNLLEILKQLVAGTNKAVLVVTHDNRIFNYADSMIHINDGKIV